MSWIKTNFLWMMYRSRWCTNSGQERVLAVRITREGFDTILSKALTGKLEKEKGLKTRTEVRLQWDPDHAPSGLPEKRRAIQLGLRDEVNIKVKFVRSGGATPATRVISTGGSRGKLPGPAQLLPQGVFQ